MRKSVSILFFILILVVVLVIFSHVILVNAEPKTIFVPDDFLSIADAIGNVTKGDTIFIKSGTYNEHSLVINKTLTIIGEDANTTIINNIDELEWNFVNPFPPNTITLEIVSNATKIYNLTLSSNSRYSIGISGKSDQTTIAGNIITTQNRGIHLEGSNQLIANNKIEAHFGIHVTGSYNIIINNTLSTGRIMLGRLPERSPDTTGHGDNYFNLVYGNIIPSGTIFLSGSETIVAENEIGAVSIGSGSNNLVFANKITNGSGIHIAWGINNTFYANEVSNNQKGAFVVGGTRSVITNSNGTWITNNSIYHNNFIHNDRETWTGHPDYGFDYMYEAVTGSSGYPINNYDNGTEGNYWSNYNGTDTNGDGIGNSPYLIDFSGNNKDNYPLMAPFNTSNCKIDFPDWAHERISVEYIPEFPSWLFLPFFIFTTIAVFFCKNKLDKK